jgi:hypothetical protein
LPLPNTLPRAPSTPLAAIVKEWLQFSRVRQPDHQYAWTTDRDHEDAGIETPGGGSYLGVFGVHAVYKQGTIQLTAPAGATQTQTLYAPTTRPPNGSCLEIGTAYTTEPGRPTTAYVYVYDFCSAHGAFVRTDPIDDEFVDTYAGARIGTVAAYTAYIYTPDRRLSEETEWLAVIRNYKLSRWELLWSTHGYFSDDRRGWSIFETWYRQGQCSKSLPVIGAAGLMFFDSASSAWEAVNANMVQLQNSLHPGGNCFGTDGQHGPPSYQLSLLPSRNAWQVSSTGQ